MPVSIDFPAFCDNSCIVKGQLALSPVPEGKMGPAMKSLNERQRLFVVAMLEQGSANASAAARAAGYSAASDEYLRVQGHRLAHDERVMAAIQEEAQRRLNSGAGMAVVQLLQIAETSIDQRTKLKAIEMILNRAGLHARTEHKVTTIDGNSDASLLERGVALATKLGIDPRTLFGQHMPAAVEVEFEDVTSDEDPSNEGLEDLL